MKIDRYTLEAIAEAVDGEPRFDYSGRAMFGAGCAGIVVPSPARLVKIGSVVTSLANDGEIDDDLARRMANSVAIDSMGLGMIVYWPTISVDE